MEHGQASFSPLHISGPGHLCVMTRAYEKVKDQQPNDLALLGIDTLVNELRHSFPEIQWMPRITFGGLIDIPDTNGETRIQSPVSGLGVDLLSQGSPEWKILNIQNAIVRGRVIHHQGEMMISEELAQNLDIQPGQVATLISSTMNGSMATANFTIVGTILFGVRAMDRSAVITDLSDIQQALDLQQGAGKSSVFSRMIFIMKIVQLQLPASIIAAFKILQINLHLL